MHGLQPLCEFCDFEHHIARWTGGAAFILCDIVTGDADVIAKLLLRQPQLLPSFSYELGCLPVFFFINLHGRDYNEISELVKHNFCERR